MLNIYTWNAKYIQTGKWKFYAQKKAEYKEMQVKYILNFIKCFNYSKYRYTCRWKEG